MNKRHQIRTVIKELKTKTLGKQQFENRVTSKLPTQIVFLDKPKSWREDEICWLLVVIMSENGNSMREFVKKTSQKTSWNLLF